MAFEGGEDGGSAMDALLGGAAGDAGDKAGGSSSAAGAEGGAQGGGEDGDKGFVAPDWFEKVSAEAGEGENASNRDWLTAKGYKDLDAVVKSARHAEKALHDRGMVAVPKDGAKPEDVAAFRTAIGVPDKIEGYEVKAPDGVPLNEPLIASLRESALKHGAPKGAFEGLVNDFIQMQIDETAQTQKAQNDSIAEKVAEWGAKKDENTAHVEAAARGLGLSREEVKWFRTMPSGAGRALDLLAKLGSGMAEDVLMTGGKGRFGVSGAEAKTQMDAMKADPEVAKKIMVLGSPERARWDRLNQAYSEHTVAQQQG